MRIKEIFLIFFILFFCILYSEIVDDTYGFAKFLYETGEYERASGEFLKFGYSLYNNSIPDSIYYEIAKCNLAINKYDRTIYYFQKISEIDSEYYMTSIDGIAYSYQKLEQYNESINFINLQMKTVELNDIYTSKLCLIQSINFAKLSEWEKSLKEIEKSLQFKYSDYANNVKKIIIKGNSLKHKSPTAGLLLSSVIPGLGKVYAGKPKDAVYSFLLVSISGWQSYRGFSNDGVNSLRGWFSSALFTSFYIGNLYGSFVEVKLYNYRKENEIVNQLNIEFQF